MSWWRSPWPTVLAAPIPAVLLLLGVSLPGGYLAVLRAALAGWSIVGVAWLVAAASSALARPRPRRRHWRRLGPLLIVPIVFAASWTAASGDLVGRIMFRLHRAQLEQLAATVAAAPWSGSRTVGLYSFEDVSGHNGCVLFATKDPAMAKTAGLAWCPGRPPDAAGWSEGQVFEPFDDGWYVFVARHELWRNRFRGARPWGLQLGELRSRPSV